MKETRIITYNKKGATREEAREQGRGKKQGKKGKSKWKR
jgi:hypothetical protein